MNTNRATLEVIAPTIEEAIAKGLADLGLPLESVEVETLDEGSRGLFGLGSRQARVRLTVKSNSQPAKPLPVQQSATAPEPVEEEPMLVEEEFEEEFETEEEAPSKTPVRIPDELQLHVARETILELLEKMNITSEVDVRYGETDPHSDRTPILIDIHGDDLSILIGKRAETLNALQYITNLIVSKELGHGITIVIDVEGYRQRRESQIRQLARRMAEQAVRTGRKQVLEPMPANERRIVHMELRENEDVKTESTGEEPHRKVNIIPLQ